MKKLVSKIVVPVLALSMFAGCGNSSETSNQTDQTKGNTSANSGEVTKVTVWRPQDKQPIEDWYIERIESFNKEYAGKYELEQQIIIRADSFAYEDKVNTAISSNTLPDILMVDGPNISNYAANNIIIPIDDYISEEDKADYLDSTIVQDTYDNKLFAIGPTESSVALYYNKDMLDAIGVTAPTKLEDAWTWDEFYDIAKKLTTDEVSGARIIMDKGEGVTYVMEPFWVSNGTDIINAEGTTSTGYLNSDKGIEAATYLNKFIQEGISNIDPLPTEFYDGKAAMMLGGSWEISVLQNDYPDLNWGVTYFPVANGGKPASPTGDWSYTITKDAKDLDAASTALNWLTNQEATINYAKAISKPPTRKSAFEAMTEYNEYPQSIIKEQLMETGSPRPRTPVYTVLSPRFAEGMIDIFTGADIKETLDRVASEVDEEYQNNYAE